MTLNVDPGTYKNGAAVTVPHSEGGKGNLIAAAMGAFTADSSTKLEVLQKVTSNILQKAITLVENENVEYSCMEDKRVFYVEARVQSDDSWARCVLSGGHTNIIVLEKDGQEIDDGKSSGESDRQDYRSILKEMSLKDILGEVVQLDQETREYLQRGVEMNLAIAEAGVKTRRTAYQLLQMKESGVMAEDLLYNVKLKVAGAVDARMSGYPLPVMTSGGSGNQGAVGILTPYLVGRHQGIDLKRIQESIAITHAINSYIKCFIGELSVVCGCSMAAGIAVAAAIVYQQCGIDMEKIAFAIDNVIGDLSGLICDGAKPGCAMKTVTAVDTALRSGFMAIAGYGLSVDDGIIGTTPENSIRNLSRIALEGMFQVDPTVIHILQDKATSHGRA
ncbi:MAG: serine dehydratase subunit alpha family protein, partial [Deltaproteobacteria bacterium]|nr:serine dehydratase subunit alpha family protein [Deltaproteobacteria bacterium]